MKLSIKLIVILILFSSSNISAQSLNEIDSVLKKSPLNKSQSNVGNTSDLKENSGSGVSLHNKTAQEKASPKDPIEPNKLDLAKLNEIGRTSTVLVFTYKNREIDSVGSGFFINEDLILTNSHVVDEADLFEVISSAGERQKATLVANGMFKSGNDFAILKASFNNRVSPVRISSAYNPLESVYAFGFPVLAIKDDVNFIALINGDTKVLPNLVSSTGNIQQIRKNDQNIEVILHSAKISGGNSGGPLIDQCGRVIGINTYTINQKAAVKMNDGSSGEVSVDSGYDFSLSGRSIIEFLQSRKIDFVRDQAKC